MDVASSSLGLASSQAPLPISSGSLSAPDPGDRPIAAAAVAAFPAPAASSAAASPADSVEMSSSAAAAPAPQSGPQTPFSKVVAKLFSDDHDVHVTYKISHNPNEIITVFTDKDGKVVNEVPPEVILQIVQFFNQHSGALTDRSV